MARRKQPDPDESGVPMTDTPDEGKTKSRKRKRRGKGEGTIYQRKDGRWVAEITLEDGKRKPLYGKTQEEAIAKLKEAQYQQRQGTLATGPRQKLGEHVTWWLEEVKKRTTRSSTYMRYRVALYAHILPALGHLQLNKVTLRVIQRFYNQKLDEGQSPSSVITMNTVLHQAFEYAVNERLIGVNPCRGVALPTKKKRELHPLTIEQAQQLLQSAQGTMFEPFIALALTLGVRHGELLALRWQDIDFAQGVLSIHHTLTVAEDYHFVVGDPKTEAGERAIMLPQPVSEILVAYRTEQTRVRAKAGPAWQEHDLVFCTPQGKQLGPGDVRQRFYRLLKRAGLPRIHIHDLRHSAATLMRSMGVDLKVIQEILGHSTLDMTANIYSHVLPSMQKEAVERMNHLFQKPS
jgi:integrase